MYCASAACGVRSALMMSVSGQLPAVDRIAERRQPVILLIEQTNGWRCFRFEEEVAPLEAIEVELAVQ